ncbi:hypothetical protein RDABS01_001199 [Bienertia sinuspersici]
MEKKFFGVMLLLLFLFASEMNMVAKVEGARCRNQASISKVFAVLTRLVRQLVAKRVGLLEGV